MKTSNWLIRALHKTQSREVRSPFQTALMLADTARDGKNWLQAAECYREAIILNPDEIHLHVQLGHMLKELGEYEASEQQYRQYAEIHPDDSDIYLQLGHLLNRQDRVEEAVLLYEHAAQLAPRNQDIAAHLQRLRASAGARPAAALRRQALISTDRRHWEEAYGQLVELIDVQGHADLNTVLGNVCKELGNFSEALERYRISERIARTNDDLLVLLDISMQMGHLCKIQQKSMLALKHYVFVKDTALTHSLSDLYAQAWKEIGIVRRERTTVFE